MTNEKFIAGRVKLENVRGSFLHLWKPTAGSKNPKEGDPLKFRARGLINKEKAKSGELKGVIGGKRMPILDALKKAKHDAIAAKLGDEGARKLKIRSDNYCVRDGDEENYDGYEGCFYISATNSERPKVKGRDKRNLKPEDGIPYSGCYLDMWVTMWYQAAGEKNGQPTPHAVWASLEAIQYRAEGERFGNNAPIDDDEFEDLTDETDELDESDLDEGDDGDDLL